MFKSFDECRKNLETSLDYYYVGNVEKISDKKTKPLKNYLNKHLKLKNKKEKSTTSPL